MIDDRVTLRDRGVERSGFLSDSNSGGRVECEKDEYTGVTHDCSSSGERIWISFGEDSQDHC